MERTPKDAIHDPKLGDVLRLNSGDKSFARTVCVLTLGQVGYWSEYASGEIRSGAMSLPNWTLWASQPRVEVLKLEGVAVQPKDPLTPMSTIPTAELAALRSDKKRLDWLSDPATMVFRCMAFGMSMRHWLKEGPREALDSAMKENVDMQQVAAEMRADMYGENGNG
jgi:hypothetical protein